jgi:hypothetical protein
MLLVLACLVIRCAQGASPVSTNIVGYYNVRLFPGENLIANQVVQGDNALNTVLINGAAAGSTFTMWDPSANNFLPLSVFDGSTWSINYAFDLGRGGVLNSPAMATNTFVGNVVIYTNILGSEFGSGLHWHPNYANSLHLLSIPDPIAASGDDMFSYVTDRSPNDGEWIRTLDPMTQTYTTTTYHTGSGWDNGDPMLNVGQAAWFNLGPVAVPEPSAIAMLAMSAVLFWTKKTPFRKDELPRVPK